MDSSVASYLHDVLGVPPPAACAWSRANELPYFLRDAFELSELNLLGHPVILAIARDTQTSSLSDIKIWLDRVSQVAGQPVLYATSALASYERRRLIELKVPFVVPGNQLYLPDLGLDLREYFRERASTEVAPLSPSTQAVLIATLLRKPWANAWEPAELGNSLGYTRMTSSRAAKELTAAGLATADRVGRANVLTMTFNPEQTWAHAKAVFRSPVKRTVWTLGSDVGAPPSRRIAGQSALARYSNLTEPRWPVFAITDTDWKAAGKNGAQELFEPRPGAEKWQIWSYSPALLDGASTVDPFSLMLSLEDDADDRIQIALDELKEQIKW